MRFSIKINGGGSGGEDWNNKIKLKSICKSSEKSWKRMDSALWHNRLRQWHNNYVSWKIVRWACGESGALTRLVLRTKLQSQIFMKRSATFTCTDTYFNSCLDLNRFYVLCWLVWKFHIAYKISGFRLAFFISKPFNKYIVIKWVLSCG